jgi:NAD(P) transhydrogenase
MWTKERRVALTPIAVQTLIKKGISVRIESNAGSEAKFLDSDYESVGAKIVDRKAIFESDVILKVRQPLDEELALFRNNSTLISFLYPAQNQKLIDQLSAKQLNVFAMDCIPRISRAQVFDALSSMANIAGYL